MSERSAKNLILVAYLLFGVAVIWWGFTFLKLATEIGVSPLAALQCLTLRTLLCDMGAGIIQAAGIPPYQPVLSWCAAALGTWGEIAKRRARNEARFTAALEEARRDRQSAERQPERPTVQPLGVSQSAAMAPLPPHANPSAPPHHPSLMASRAPAPVPPFERAITATQVLPAQPLAASPPPPLPAPTGDAGEDTWRMIAERNRPELIEEFLRSFPDHPRAMMARIRHAELTEALAYDHARQSGDPAEMEAFTSRFPSHPQAKALEAKGRGLREAQAFTLVAGSTDREVLATFLKEFPGSSRAAMTRERLRTLEASLAEGERWAAVKARADAGEISDYIWRTRFGPTVEEARAILKQLAQERWEPLRAKAGSLEVLAVRALLERDDAKELHGLAREFLDAKDKEEWERTELGQPTTQAALERYLALFPHGYRRAEAMQKLGRLAVATLPPHLRNRASF